MGGKTQTSTTSSNQSYTPTGLSNLQDIFNRASNAASTPYTPYTGQLTAGLTPTQQNAITGANNAAGIAQPYFSQAGDLVRGAASPLTASQIAQYSNPFTQSVIDATRANFAEDNGQQQQQVKGSAAMAGALGGDRQAVAQSELARQQKLAQDPVIAGLQSQGYQQAVQTAQQQFQQNPMAAAAALGNIGAGAQNAALQGVQGQLTAGGVEQQTNQAGLTNDYQQYLNALAFPYQNAQFLAGIGIPASGAMGGTTTGDSTSTQPGPSLFSQILGLGTLGLGAYAKSDRRAKEDIKPVGKLFDGQPVYSFRYKGSPMTQIGLMAQDVEKKNPGAVKQIDGVKGVDYDVATSDAASKGHFASGGLVASPFQNIAPLDFIHDVRGYVPTPVTISAGSTPHPSASVPTAGASQANNNPFASLNSAYGLGSTIGGAYDKFMATPFASGAASAIGDPTGIGGLYARGGSVRRYADGGATFDDRFSAAFPFAGPATDEATPIVPDPGLQQVSPQAMQDWRNSVDRPNPALLADVGAPQTTPDSVPLPLQITGPQNDAGLPDAALAFSGDGPQPTSPLSLAPSVVPAGSPTPQQSGNPIFGYHLSDNASTGLMAAGLGMLASRSPFAGVALGEGGLQGLAAYSAANKADQEAADKRIAQAQNQARIDQEAKRIANQATQFAVTSGETARHNRASEQKSPSFGIIGDNPDTGAHIYGWRDPQTGKVTDSQGNPVNPETFAPKGATLDTDGKPITGDAYLATLSPGRATLAKQIADYKVNPAGLSIRGGHREQAIADATRYNPDYDQRLFTASNRAMTNFFGGQEGRTVRSLNVAIDHLSTLDEAATAMKNSDFPALNRIVNSYRQQTGSPLSTNFDSIRQVVSAEVAKSVVGGQTALHDRDDLAQRASNASSPAQLSGIITEFKKLMAGQMKGLRKQYEVTTRAKNFDDFLEPQTKAELSKLAGVKDNYSPSGSSAAPITKTLNGKTYVQRDGQWYAQ